MDDHLKKVKKDFEESAYWQFLGLKMKELSVGRAELELPFNPSFKNARDIVHGGVIASMLDMTMGVLGKSLGYDEVMTLNMGIQFLKPVGEETIYSEASIINEGRSASLIEAKLLDESGNIIAHSTGAFKLVKRE